MEFTTTTNINTEELGEKPLVFEEYHRKWVKNCKDAYANWLGMCFISLPKEYREKILGSLNLN